ncbi:hypothetical protein [Nakamurella leprariae]|uniref:Uncharacterized protein n=1 Tax=Nakamurella leprariae TaxID=2803911 RepID=A0A938YF83_9ACTN|nr:hypothetical protein [Nakamurella leprariae]MBM9466713.1 hypothetical protein [Nakamurella leprariae]
MTVLEHRAGLPGLTTLYDQVARSYTDVVLASRSTLERDRWRERWGRIERTYQLVRDRGELDGDFVLIDLLSAELDRVRAHVALHQAGVHGVGPT